MAELLVVEDSKPLLTSLTGFTDRPAHEPTQNPTPVWSYPVLSRIQHPKRDGRRLPTICPIITTTATPAFSAFC